MSAGHEWEQDAAIPSRERCVRCGAGRVARKVVEDATPYMWDRDSAWWVEAGSCDVELARLVVES